MTDLSSTAIVVVNYGSHELLETNLVPLSAGVSPNAGTPLIVVVDNATTPAERAAVTAQAQAHGWLTVLPDANLGFGAGVNRGVRAALDAGALTFVILNPDATIAPDQLATLVAHVEAAPMTLAAPMIVDGADRPVFYGYRVDLTDGATRSPRSALIAGHRHAEWLTGACFALSAELWEATGGMAEDYFLYWEDVDFSLRVLAAGGRLLNDTSIVARHVEGGTQRPSRDTTGDKSADAGAAETEAASRSAGQRHSATYYYWNVRNRLLLGTRWARREELARWVRRTPQESWRILLRGGRRQILTHPTTTLVPAVRGAIDGLWLVHRERFTQRERPNDR
ncbi:glycosyltransferase family 2 protein [Actinomyces ruminis]|uniref:Glycosyltransferase family 2 protein n=1 Tax=Actinomyces ruminis TaxID=1937003 RepID=A0ABX4MHL8_9ACTO|nr:glycosyltransferase family 2 protein [Actinomyces ruminis]PHP53649.1 glycosyltransferase family 2 protein [Actinomyces ruminis]